MSLSTTAAAAFEAGRLAFEAGAEEAANPYAQATDEHLSWNDGYNAAAEESLDEGDE